MPDRPRRWQDSPIAQTAPCSWAYRAIVVLSFLGLLFVAAIYYGLINS